MHTPKFPCEYPIAKKFRNRGINMGIYIAVEPNVNIYVEDLNPAGCKTILFIHGWPGNHNLFEYQFNQLPKQGYRCIGIDCRGFGLSDKPWTGYDYNSLSDDVRCVVEALNLNNFVLAGHSTGGAICVRYMARHAGYGVVKLALFAAAAPSLVQRPYFPYGLEMQAVIDIIAGTYKDRPSMLRKFGKTIFFNPVSGPLADWIFQLGLQAASWSTVAVERAWLSEQLFDDLTKVRVPTLIMHGVHDQIVPYPLGVIQNKLIAGSRLVTFENGGHGSFYDEKDKFNSELARFISA